MKMQGGQKRWTSGETLIKIGLLMLTLAVLIPAWMSWQDRKQLHRTRQDIVLLLTSSEQFFADYGYWPTLHNGEYGDYRYGFDLPNREVLNVLEAMDGVGNPDHQVNPRKIRYLDVTGTEDSDAGMDDGEEFKDPWGTPYQIVLDTDLNNTCYIDQSSYLPQIGHGILVWSCGPDRKSDTRDDILSWRM